MPYWAAKSNSQNRPLRAEAYFDPQTGELVSRQSFEDRHTLDKIVGVGIAAHEGQLFGWVNQLLGLLTAIGLVLLSVTGVIMWRKRSPQGVLGAPPALPQAKFSIGFLVIIFTAAVLLPLLGASIIAVLIIEKVLVVRWNWAKNWLGLCP